MCHYSTMSVSLKVALQVRGAWVLAVQDLAESVRNSKDLPRSPASDLALLYSRACFWIPSGSGVLMYLSLKYSIGILARRFKFLFLWQDFFFFLVICVFKKIQSSKVVKLLSFCSAHPIVSSFSTYIIMQCYLLCWLPL